MYDPTLVELLKKLEKKEWKRVRLFLDAPNKNGTASKEKGTVASQEATIVKLVNYLDRLYPDFKEEKKFSKEVLLKKVYAEERSKGFSRLDADFNTLKQLVEDTLIHTHLERNSVWRGKLLADAFAARDLHKERQKVLDPLVETLEGIANPGADIYQLRSSLSTQLFFHPGKEKYRSDMTLLTDAISDLEKYYLITKSRLLSEQLQRYRTLNILQVTDDDDGLDENLVAAHYDDRVIRLHNDFINLLQLKTHHDSFKKVWGDFKFVIDNLEAFDKRHIAMKMVYLANYYYEKRYLSCLHKIFSIFRYLDRKNILTDNGQLSNILFVSIVAVAARKGKYDWAEEFMEKYKNSIPGPHRNAAVKLAKAHLDYYQGRFQEAISELEEVSKSHGAHYIQSETLQICIFFDLIVLSQKENAPKVEFTIRFKDENEEESKKGFIGEKSSDCDDGLSNSIDRFRHYLEYHPELFNEHKIKAIKMFFKLTKKMAECVKLKDKERNKSKTEIGSLFKKAEVVYCGAWLSERIKQL